MFLTDLDAEEERTTLINLKTLAKECLSMIACGAKPNVKEYVVCNTAYEILTPDNHLNEILVTKLLDSSGQTPVTKEVDDESCTMVKFDLSRFGYATIYYRDYYYISDSEVPAITGSEVGLDPMTNEESDYQAFSYEVPEDTTSIVDDISYNKHSRITKIVFNQSEYGDVYVRNLFFYNASGTNTATYTLYKMPHDFISFSNVTTNTYVSEDDEIYMLGKLFYNGKNKFYLKVSQPGTYNITYNATYPDIYDIDDIDDLVLDIPYEVISIVPTYVAAQLSAQDDPVRATMLRNEFEVLLSRLDKSLAQTPEPYYNSWEE